MSDPASVISSSSLPENSPIGPYRVVRLLGQGGMGVVYEAMHTAIGRRVAIKVLRAELAADKELAGRFMNEARTVNRVEHPGVVQVVDLGEQQSGEPYIVMEFLRGETLAEVCRRRGGPLPWPEAVHYVLQIAEVLQAAHREGIVHRDLKPENVMLVDDSQLPLGKRVKLLDFGIAKIIDEVNSNHFKTKTGALMGSPAYMSPEQCKGGERITVQADLYALGVVLYELLVGALPHVADGPGHMLVLHMFATPRPLRHLRPGLPEPLYALVDRLLQKTPDARPPIAEALQQLQQLAGRGAAAPARGKYWAVGAGLAVLLTLLLLSLWGKARSGAYFWQPAKPLVASPPEVLPPPVVAPSPSSVAAPVTAPAAAKPDPRPASRPNRPSPPTPPKPAPPTSEPQFVPVDVVKRPAQAPMPMKAVR